MTSKEQKIIELLQQGKPYSYIQSVVQVSPSKIASVKKVYMESSSESSDTTDDTTTILPTTTDVNTDSRSATTTDYLESQNELINNIKNKLTMNTDEIFEDDDLEKIKLRLAHDLAMRKIDRENEELELRKKELRLKEDAANSDKRKIEKQGRTLIFHFRKLAEKVKNGDFTFGEIDKYSEKATELREEVEQYCFENEIDSDELSILVILRKMESEFESMQDEDYDDNDINEVEFEDDTLEMVERANEVDFDSYE